MYILHFSTRKGFRFFRKIKKILPIEIISNGYIFFPKKDYFLSKLYASKDAYDFVLITAHGDEDSIIRPIDPNNPASKYKPFIVETDTPAFKNNFVFTVSCLTAVGFGKRCIENGALSYLGYDVEIGNILWPIFRNSPYRLNDNFRIIFNRIFLNELCKCITFFSKNICTVKELKQRFSFGIDKRLAELNDMDCQQIFDTYNIKIPQHQLNKYAPYITMKYLSDINETNRHLIIWGDQNYFSDGFIKYLLEKGEDRQSVKEKLCCSDAFLNMQNKQYKDYLLGQLM